MENQDPFSFLGWECQLDVCIEWCFLVRRGLRSGCSVLFGLLRSDVWGLSRSLTPVI